jgi:hypothetical protein
MLQAPPQRHRAFASTRAASSTNGAATTPRRITATPHRTTAANSAFAIAISRAIHQHPRVDAALQNWAAWASSADTDKPRLHPSSLSRITTSPPAEDDEPSPSIDEKAAHKIDDIIRLPAFTLPQRKLIRNLYQTTTTDHQLAHILGIPESAVLQMIDEAFLFIGRRV